MTIQELIDALEEARDDGIGADAPVRIAYQPSYPLRGSISHITTNQDPEDAEDKMPFFLWIVLSEQLKVDESPYASKTLWDKQD